MATALVGISISLQNMSPWEGGNNGTDNGDFIGLIGVGMFCCGVAKWISNGHRHHQIKKTIQTLSIQMGSLQRYHKTKCDVYQLDIMIYF